MDHGTKVAAIQRQQLGHHPPKDARKIQPEGPRGIGLKPDAFFFSQSISLSNRSMITTGMRSLGTQFEPLGMRHQEQSPGVYGVDS
jgi:hypothetical protein